MKWIASELKGYIIFAPFVFLGEIIVGFTLLCLVIDIAGILLGLWPKFSLR